MTENPEGLRMPAVLDTVSTILDRFLSSTGARGAAVVSRDGLPMVSVMPASVNLESFAAMSATMLGAADTAAAQVTDESANRLVADFDNWQLVALEAGPDAVVVVIAKKKDARKDLLAACEALASEIRSSI